MAAFGESHGKVAEYVGGDAGKGRPAAGVLTAPPRPRSSGQGLPMRVGPGANPGIILRGDTFVELGNPERAPAPASCGPTTRRCSATERSL